MDIGLHLITSSDELETIREIYLSSFPASERREYSELEKQLVRSENQMFQVRSNKAVIGFLSLWIFAEFVFIEHLAISSTQRGKGFGKTIMQRVMEIFAKPIVLEVEPPTDDVSRRRVRFYSGLGMSILPVVYIQPSYDGVKPPVELRLMTNYSQPTDAWVEHCVSIITSTVYCL
jgi:ribosomal protein S18 acetylase RimI-like enzyme